ncbi:oxidoreductase [Streptomyces sp. NPDC056159]|uniref:globin domain-containing protein n=1 Tax=Streptomyces sp. NPDC056159 TaxID=3155537 RepID=UPI0034233D9D
MSDDTAKHPTDRPGTPSIYQWAGVALALQRLTEVFYGHVRKDPLLAPVFAHMDDKHPHFVALWLGEVFGGPTHYSAFRGGHQHMATQHLGRGITEEQRRRWVGLLNEAGGVIVLDPRPHDSEVVSYFI